MMRALLVIVAAATVMVAYAEDQKPAAQHDRSGVAEQREADRRDSRDQKSAQQERMVACNKQAREKEMRGAMRMEFMRDCLKGETAATGGRR